jgi:MFS family permease
MTELSTSIDQPAGYAGKYWSGYQVWVLGLVTLIATTSYIDRSVLGILQESIKHELKLTDLQLGLLSGAATNFFYVLLGVPIARLAERYSRKVIIIAAVSTWSGMTAACGLMVNYGQLVLCRVGVSIGDAGCSAPIHSLIADYFPTRSRGRAMAVFNTCIPIGLFFGALLGGVLARHWGWRVAFIAVGCPGIVLALLAKLTLREPRRGQSDTHAEAAIALKITPGTREALATMFGNRAFVQMASGCALIGFAVYGVNFFTASFFLRRFGLSLAQVATITALAQGGAGLLGTLLGGWLADRHEAKNGRSYPYVCGIGAVIAAVFFLLAFSLSDWRIAAAVLLVANVGVAMKNGPAFAAVLNIVPARMRATAAAVNLLGISLFGAILGPLAVGAISDFVARHTFPAALGQFKSACPGGRAIASSTPDMIAACVHTSTHGVQVALVVASIVFLWSALHFYLAGRVIGRYWHT